MEWRQSRNQLVRYFFIILFIFLTPLVQAELVDSSLVNIQKTETDYSLDKNEFDQERWKNVTKGLDYSDVKEKKELKEPSLPNFSLPNVNLQGILIALFALLILALLIWLLKGAKTTSNLRVKDNFSMKEFLKAEGEDQNLDLEQEILSARESGDFVLAIRLMYLQIIAWLSIKKDIKWKKDKTNYQYLYELKANNKPTEDFLFFTQVYEHTWFGKKEVTSLDFDQIDQKYQVFEQNRQTITKS